MNAFKHYYLAIEKLRMKIVECSLDSVFKLNKFSPSCTLFYKAIVKRRPMLCGLLELVLINLSGYATRVVFWYALVHFRMMYEPFKNSDPVAFELIFYYRPFHIVSIVISTALSRHA